MTLLLSLLAAAASLALAFLGALFLFLARTARMYRLTYWLAGDQSGGRITDETIHRYTIANGLVCLLIAAILAFFAIDAALL